MRFHLQGRISSPRRKQQTCTRVNLSKSPRDFLEMMLHYVQIQVCHHLFEHETRGTLLSGWQITQAEWQRFHMGRCEWCPTIPTCHRFLWENPYCSLGCSLMVMRPMRPYHPPVLSMNNDYQPAVLGIWTMIKHH